MTLFSFPHHRPSDAFVLLYAHHPSCSCCQSLSCHHVPASCQNLSFSLSLSCCSTPVPCSSSCDASSPLQNPPRLTHLTTRCHCCLSSKTTRMFVSRFDFDPSVVPSRPVFELALSSTALSSAPPSLSKSGYFIFSDLDEHLQLFT